MGTFCPNVDLQIDMSALRRTAAAGEEEADGPEIAGATCHHHHGPWSRTWAAVGEEAVTSDQEIR